MADPFIAEIRTFPFTFAPRGWAFCNGQLLPIAQNTALFSLLGTTFGGDGKTNFALPNLQGRAAMHPGQGPGLTPRDLGESAGSETVTLLGSQLAPHTHALMAQDSDGAFNNPTNHVLASSSAGVPQYSSSPPDVDMNANGLLPTGGDGPHNNMQPYLTLHFCIALQGVFPPRG